MARKLTRAEAEEAFRAVAALREQIAFDYLLEGCECRAQLMIEHLQGMGWEPGRAWAISVGRRLAFPQPRKPGHFYRWANHVAPTVALEESEEGLVVLDPSLSQTGPLPLGEFLQVIRARSVHLSGTGLSEAEILDLQSARALRGENLDTVVFTLRLGEPPITNRGGSGFRIGLDPPEGAGDFARAEMRRVFRLLRQKGSGQP